MELLDEDLQKNNKKNKTTTTLLVIIILLLFIVMAVVALIFLLKEDKVEMSIDKVDSPQLKEILVIDENNPSKVYIPIRKIASFLQYKDYSGNYDNPSESNEKCYVENEYEIANFSLNSNQITKKEIKEKEMYETIEIDEPVIAMNGELYTTIDGIEKAFNVSFNYNPDDKSVVIYTMPYLVQFYTSSVVESGYLGIDENFNNQKAILDNMLVVTKENQKYAVLTTNGKKVLEDKYDNIQYLQASSEFVVTSNQKVGIISKTRETKVDLIYDDMKLISRDKNLYLVKKDNKYGIIDDNGNIIIYPEYEEIGIDSKLYKSNGITNDYILKDSLIPLKINEKWGLANIDGKKIVDFQYDELGCIISSTEIENNLLMIPDHDIIVVRKNNKYTVITKEGKEVWTPVFDAIYVTKTNGKTQYILASGKNTWDLLEKLKESGIEK